MEESVWSKREEEGKGEFITVDRTCLEYPTFHSAVYALRNSKKWISQLSLPLPPLGQAKDIIHQSIHKYLQQRALVKENLALLEYASHPDLPR